MLLTTQEEQVESWDGPISKIYNKDDNSVGSKQDMINIEEEEEEEEAEDNGQNENELK